MDSVNDKYEKLAADLIFDGHPNEEDWKFFNGGMKGNVHPWRLGSQLKQAWQEQADFNKLVKGVQSGIVDWPATYLLGAAGEVGEILQELQWKKHQKHTAEVNRENLADELADITKYIWSLFQEFGFTAEEMLEAVEKKSKLVRLKLAKEFFPPGHRRVILTDLDGTACDFRRGFAEWLHIEDKVASLAVDSDNGIPYGEYAKLKDEFERGGGYRDLPAYPDWVNLIKAEQASGSFIFVATARPSDRYKRIADDTLTWLEQQGIKPDTILFGRDERIISLLELAGDNEVVLLDDDPGLASRAANAGIFVWLREQPYNIKIGHTLIHRFKEFPEEVDWKVLSYIKEQDAKAK